MNGPGEVLHSGQEHEREPRRSDEPTPQPDALPEHVYAELQRIAAAEVRRWDRNATLTPTELVHEAWLRTANADVPGIWKDACHFRAGTCNAMRRTLVEHFRRRKAEKHGGAARRVTLSSAIFESEATEFDLEALDVALDRLAKRDARVARVVELRYFGGLEIADIAAHLGISARTVDDDWAFAKVWLNREITSLGGHAR